MGGGTFFGGSASRRGDRATSGRWKIHPTNFLSGRDDPAEEPKMATRKKSKTSKRTVISPHGSRRYVRRNKQGEFKKQVKVGKSLAADRKRSAKTKVKKGQGDRGDVKR